MAAEPAPPFDEATARTALAAAAVEAGLAPSAAADAALVGISENAVFELAGVPAVAKVGRDATVGERAERGLRVAVWLAGNGIPAVRPADAVPPRAFRGNGHPVTFWQQLPEPTRAPLPAARAPLLRALHALPRPADLALPGRDLLGNVGRWLAQAAGHIAADDAAFLLARRNELRDAAAALRPVLPPGPIHGDALPRNIHIGPEGPLLIDLETFADDLREHDLVVLSLSHDRYGLPDDDYRAFTAAYGWNVEEWDGCAVLRGARETASAAWVAQQAASNPRALAEFRHRVASLRDGDTTARWHAF